LPDGGVFVGDRSYPALVLNADFRPLSYFPLSVWAWQDAVKALFLDRVSVLSEYGAAVHSPSLHMKLPSVIALKEYIPAARRPAFTRFNVFLRDSFACQYCGEGKATHDLTFDHVVPRSRGGRTTWSNFCRASHILFWEIQRFRNTIYGAIGVRSIVKLARSIEPRCQL
jgi:hypothetical protein